MNARSLSQITVVAGTFCGCFCLTENSALAENARIIGVRRAADGAPALLLHVNDGAELSMADLSALLDSTTAAGGSDREIAKRAGGHRYGNIFVPAEAKKKVVALKVKPRAPKPVKSATPPTVNPQPAAQPQKPDITIFAPDKPAAAAPKAEPPVKSEAPEPKPVPPAKP